MNKQLSLALIVAAFVAAGGAAAAILTPTADTYLNSTTPGANYGELTEVWVRTGASGDPSWNTLMKFDLPILAPGQTVESATLTFNGTVNSNAFLYVWRVTTDWDEASATWDNAKTGTAWTTAGGDYTGPEYSYASALVIGSWVDHTATFDVKPLVNEWYAGTPNYGLLLTFDRLGNNEFYGKSSEAASGGPTLTLTTVPEPAALALLGLGGVALLGRRSRRAIAG